MHFFMREIFGRDEALWENQHRIKQIQKKFVSNKKDNGLHGYGMKNIQDIVKKYDGIFQYKVYEDQLIFMISIYTDMHRDCY